jgi:hypothetical protein
MQWLTSRCLHQLVYRAYKLSLLKKTLHWLSYSKVTLRYQHYCAGQIDYTTKQGHARLQVLNFAQAGCKVILKHITDWIDAAFTLNDHLPKISN